MDSTRPSPRSFPASCCAIRKPSNKCSSACGVQLSQCPRKAPMPATSSTPCSGGHEFAPLPEFRERQGLAYSIYSDLNPYRDTGCMAVYAGTSLASAAKVSALGGQRISRSENKAVPVEELRRSKDQLKGSLMLSLESSTARMSNLARQEMLLRPLPDLDELSKKDRSRDRRRLQTLRRNSSRPNPSGYGLGNLRGLKISRDQASPA